MNELETLCVYCEEALVDEDRIILGDGTPFHRACFLRQFVGGVAHIERRCSCFVEGAEEIDPPGVSLRQGAVLAMEAHQRQLQAREQRHRDN